MWTLWRNLACAGIGVALAAWQPPTHAELLVERPIDALSSATLTGSITRTDVDALNAWIQMKGNYSGPTKSLMKKGKSHVLLHLSSAGGDWASAITIGRMLRQADAGVMVSENGKCHSACVMVLAGATSRSVFGPVGIHRPYVQSTAQRSYAEVQSQFRALEEATRRFLADMNVPPALFDLMIRVPPEQIRVLTNQELAQFGLAAADPVAEEVENANEARRYGVTMQEYLERKARRDRVCDDRASYPPGSLERGPFARAYMACRTAIMQGQSWPTGTR